MLNEQVHEKRLHEAVSNKNRTIQKKFFLLLYVSISEVFSARPINIQTQSDILASSASVKKIRHLFLHGYWRVFILFYRLETRQRVCLRNGRIYVVGQRGYKKERLLTLVETEWRTMSNAADSAYNNTAR